MKIPSEPKKRLLAHADCLEALLDISSGTPNKIAQIMHETFSSEVRIYTGITVEEVIALMNPFVSQRTVLISLNDSVQELAWQYKSERKIEGIVLSAININYASGNPEYLRDAISKLKYPGNDNFSQFMKAHVLDDRNYYLDAQSLYKRFAQAAIEGNSHLFGSNEDNQNSKRA